MTMHGILLSLAYLLRIKRVKDWTLYPLARKARAFKLHERETRTLVLGSSHAQMGYLAVKGEIWIILRYGRQVAKVEQDAKSRKIEDFIQTNNYVV